MHWFFAYSLVSTSYTGSVFLLRSWASFLHNKRFCLVRLSNNTDCGLRRISNIRLLLNTINSTQFNVWYYLIIKTVIKTQCCVALVWVNFFVFFYFSIRNCSFLLENWLTFFKNFTFPLSDSLRLDYFGTKTRSFSVNEMNKELFIL